LPRLLLRSALLLPLRIVAALAALTLTVLSFLSHTCPPEMVGSAGHGEGRMKCAPLRLVRPCQPPATQLARYRHDRSREAAPRFRQVSTHRRGRWPPARPALSGAPSQWVWRRRPRRTSTIPRADVAARRGSNASAARYRVGR